MKFSVALPAGGRSSRMGRDKAFLDWHGVPLWRVQVEKLIALGPEEIFIAAREDQNFAAALARESLSTAIKCVNDPTGEDCGPIAAIARCLRLSAGPLLVLAVDMPSMTADFLRRRVLSAATDTKGVVFRGARGFEALAAVYVPAALPLFEAAEAAGRFALQPLITEIAQAGLCSVLQMQREDDPFFANVNAPDGFDQLIAMH